MDTEKYATEERTGVDAVVAAMASYDYDVGEIAGDSFCRFCNAAGAVLRPTDPIRHEDRCPVSIARRLMDAACGA